MYVCVNVCMYACIQCICMYSLTLKDIPLYDCVTFGYRYV